MDDNTKSFLQYIFEIVESVERRAQTPNISCANCGITYAEFKKSGKLGCQNCYTAFRTPISQALKSIHGTNVYKGKIPQGQADKYKDMIIKRELTENRVLLKKAVEAEEFEQAAKYRDIINDLQEKINAGQSTQPSEQR
ncbi:MAG: UvrB/UvrC motif-containing protein [Defluviitaleaceae bacterium]|nr:UvrB/UvrC motif-containing protein [Defluviitaleaceae bacterium]